MTNSRSKIVRRNKILEAALRLFAEKGFQDTTISEVSKAAGVSEATVYEYFKSKEELLFAIPEEITEETANEVLKIFPYVRGAEGKLRAAVQGYMTLYESNPLYSALVMLQLKTNRNFLKTKAYEKIRSISRVFIEFIQEGIDDGSFKKDVDPYLVRAMILGTIEHLCIRWHLLGSPANLVEHVDPLLDLIFMGIRAPESHKSLTLNLQYPNDTGLSK